MRDVPLSMSYPMNPQFLAQPPLKIKNFMRERRLLKGSVAIVPKNQI